jgi:hypothetical protein
MASIYTKESIFYDNGDLKKGSNKIKPPDYHDHQFSVWTISHSYGTFQINAVNYAMAKQIGQAQCDELGIEMNSVQKG